MLPCRRFFVLLVCLATSCQGSLTFFENHPLKKASKTIVHQRKHVPAVDLHAAAAPTAGKTVATVTHQKVPGNGYKKGSPLYSYQEAKEDADGDTKKKKTEPTNGTTPADNFDACVDKIGRSGEGNEETAVNDYFACVDKYHPTPLEAHKELQELIARNLWAAVAFAVLWFIVVLIVAFVYQRNKKDPDMTRGGMGMNRYDWHVGVFSCFETPSMCLLTCCCCPIRWADTMRMASYMSFWVGVVLMTFLELVSNLTGGIAAIIALCIAVFYRQKLRQEFGLEHSDVKTYCIDCCLYCWCSCCATIQEARQLEEAYAVGHPIRKVNTGAQRPPSQFY